MSRSGQSCKLKLTVSHNVDIRLHVIMHCTSAEMLGIITVPCTSMHLHLGAELELLERTETALELPVMLSLHQLL